MTRILIPKHLWKACELYPAPEKDEYIPMRPEPKPVPMIPSNKLPPGIHAGGYQMEEYKEDSNMITFKVTENMLAKVSHHSRRSLGPNSSHRLYTACVVG